MNIQWFPGHMTKAVREMEDSLKLVDAVIYVIDSRAISSCDNPLLNSKIISSKKVLYVFNKCDLVDRNELNKWCNKFKAENKPFVCSIGTSGDCNEIIKGLKEVSKDKIDKYKAKGVNISVRAMVVGVPNSGKSTIINAMAKKAKAITGNRPGVTKGKQWVSVDYVDLLDTPGTLWSKFSNQTIAHHLAYIGSIKDDVLDIENLAFDFIDELKHTAKSELESRYNIKISEDEETIDIYNDICLKKNLKIKGNELDYTRCAKMIIDDFRHGRLGKIILEKCNG